MLRYSGMSLSHKITFRERGEGPVLLLIHGYGGSVQHWEDVAENLKSSYRVIVPNMSHVYMSGDKILFTVQVEILADFIRNHFPGQKVFISGMSYGGCLGWALALQHPDLIERLVLVNPMVADPVSHFNLPELRYFFAMPLNLKSVYFLLSTPIGKAFLKRAALLFRDERSEGPIGVETLKGRKLMFVAHMIQHFSWVLRTADWNHWVKKMQIAHTETMLIYDCEDLLFKPESYIDFSKKFHCEEIVKLTGAGHIAIKTRPEAIAKHMDNFFKTTKQKSA